MKVTINQDNAIQLEEVFNPIILKTKDDEEMAICMRDSGFEFKYQDEWYFAKEGYVEPFHKSVRDNYLVEQKHDESVDCVPKNQHDEKPHVSRSLRECKEEWASNYDKTWEDVQKDFEYANGLAKLFVFEQVMDMVAELYKNQ